MNIKNKNNMKTIYQTPQTLVHDYRCGQHLLFSSNTPDLDPHAPQRQKTEPF